MTKKATLKLPEFQHQLHQSLRKVVKERLAVDRPHRLQPAARVHVYDRHRAHVGEGDEHASMDRASSASASGQPSASVAGGSSSGAVVAAPGSVRRALPPAEYLCPITQDVMVDPVSTCDGHTYERAAIERWLLQNSKIE